MSLELTYPGPETMASRKALDLLRSVYGYTSFRGQQQDIIEHVVAGAKRCQCRRNLPGREHEGRIPRRDHTYRAYRLAQRIIDVLVGRQRLAIARTRRAECWEKDMIRIRESCSLRGRASPNRRSISTVRSSTRPA